MSKLPYFEDPVMIKRLSEMTREQRLVWHASRAEKEMLAEPRIVQVLKTDQSLKELRYDLLHCKEYEAALEAMLALWKDSEYSTLAGQQAAQFAELRRLSAISSTFLAQLLAEFPQALTKTPLRANLLTKCSESINREEDALDRLLEIEQRIEDLLNAKDISPVGFLKSPAYISGRSESFKRFSLKYLRNKTNE